MILCSSSIKLNVNDGWRGVAPFKKKTTFTGDSWAEAEIKRNSLFGRRVAAQPRPSLEPVGAVSLRRQRFFCCGGWCGRGRGGAREPVLVVVREPMRRCCCCCCCCGHVTAVNFRSAAKALPLPPDSLAAAPRAVRTSHALWFRLAD